MTESEASLQKWFKDGLKALGVYCFRHAIVTKLPGGGYARCPDDEIGNPDIYACISGRMVAFEMKQAGKPLKPDQEKRKAEIEFSGGLYFKVDNRMDGAKILSAVKNWKRNTFKNYYNIEDWKL